MRAAAHYLYISSRGMLALRDSGKGLKPAGTFAPPGDDPDHPARAAFARLLKIHSNDEFVLLVDVVDEEQHIERIPRLRGRDRRLLISRRLEQRFRDNRFATWLPLERGSIVRTRAQRNEPVPILLTALQGDSVMQPWLEMLLEHRARIAAIYSPSLLASDVIRRIEPNGSGLLVTLQPGGLRQTLVVDGQPRFSRLAAIAQGLDGAALTAECTRTLQYLLMTQVLDRDMLREGRVKAWLIADGVQSAELIPDSLPIDNSAAIQVQMYTAATLGAPALATRDRDIGAVPLWCRQDFAGHRRGGYADAAIRLYDTVARRTTWVRRIGSAAVAASVLGVLGIESGLLMQPLLPSAEQTMVLRNQSEQRRLEGELSRFPASGTEMRNVVEMSDRLRRRHVDAGELLLLISQALASDDRLMLREIAWSRGTDAVDAAGDSAMNTPTGSAAGAPAMQSGASSGGAPAGGSVRFGEAAVARPAAAMPARAGAGSIDLSGVPPVIVRIRGRVGGPVPMNDANRRAEAFAQRLRTLCNCEATVKALPFDPAPVNGYSGSLKSGDQPRSAAFSIEMIWDRAAGSVLVGGVDGRQS